MINENALSDQFLNTPKMSLTKAAELLNITLQGVHRQLKSKNLTCSKIGNKYYLTNKTAQQIFNLEFSKRIVACQIVKGGVGKTTTVQNIACCANTYGARVLQIDIDPQGNLSDAYNVDPDNKPVLIDFIEENIPVSEGIIHLADGLDLIASRIENVILDNALINRRLPLHTFFSDLLNPISDNYDFIIIDCPPTMGQSVTAANLYADTILTPINPDKFSAKGLKILERECTFLQERYKKHIDLKIFLNKFSGNTLLSDKAINLIMSHPDMQERAMRTAVRLSQEIPNVTDANKNVFSCIKQSIAREDFDQLTRELLNINIASEKNKKTAT